jgi:Tfp pilus assembly protein PilN
MVDVRPINLIPLEERRGEHAPLRSGPLPYLLIGALVALLAGVTALVLVGNQISEREGEIARLEVEDAREKAKAERLVAYTEFRDLSEQRVETVASLANSRFDWERVMRELSLVLPQDVWLVNLLATAAPGVSVEGGAGGDSDLRASAPGPALELEGCATGQEAVAGFVTALKDIDGVTRVGVDSSELPEKGNGSGDQSGGGDSGANDDECRTRRFIAKFQIVVAFDAAPIPAVGSSAEAAPPVAPAPETTTTGESTEGG